jgi:hypothetical protein
LSTTERKARKEGNKGSLRRGIMDQAPVQIGQFILGKNLGIGAFGKVRWGGFCFAKEERFEGGGGDKASSA